MINVGKEAVANRISSVVAGQKFKPPFETQPIGSDNGLGYVFFLAPVGMVLVGSILQCYRSMNKRPQTTANDTVWKSVISRIIVILLALEALIAFTVCLLVLNASNGFLFETESQRALLETKLIPGEFRNLYFKTLSKMYSATEQSPEDVTWSLDPDFYEDCCSEGRNWTSPWTGPMEHNLDASLIVGWARIYLNVDNDTSGVTSTPPVAAVPLSRLENLTLYQLYDLYETMTLVQFCGRRCWRTVSGHCGYEGETYEELGSRAETIATCLLLYMEFEFERSPWFMDFDPDPDLREGNLHSLRSIEAKDHLISKPRGADRDWILDRIGGNHTCCVCYDADRPITRNLAHGVSIALSVSVLIQYVTMTASKDTLGLVAIMSIIETTLVLVLLLGTETWPYPRFFAMDLLKHCAFVPAWTVSSGLDVWAIVAIAFLAIKVGILLFVWIIRTIVRSVTASRS